jgi:THO complex subunit 4
MSTRDRPQARITSYHGVKRNLLGNQAGNVPPAWRDSKDKQKERGSKILLSRLPVDVGETEVEVRGYPNIHLKGTGPQATVHRNCSRKP